MVFRPKSITFIDEMPKNQENGCPARISSKTLRKTDEFTGNEEETAATGFRRKTLGK
jgi:hypothetical protein